MTFASPAARAARLLVSCTIACFAILAALAGPAAAQDFAMTGGSQSFVVPAGVRSIVVTATGAPGSDGYGENGGQGGRGGSGSVVVTRVDVTPGETLRVIVGQGGQNAYKGGGGDAGYGDGFQGGVGGDGVLSMGAGAGGSATVLMRGSSVLVVAGGGGGGGAMGGDGVTGLRGPGGAGGNGGQDPQNGGNAASTSKGPGGKAGGFSRFTQGQAGGTGLNIFFSAAGAGGGGGGGWYGGNGGGAGTTEFLAQGSGGGGGGAGGNYAGPGTSGTVITRAGNQPGGNGAMTIDAALQSTTRLTVPSAQQGNNTNIPLRATVTNWAPGQRVSFDYMDGRMPASIMRQNICRDVAVVNGIADCSFRTNVTGRYAIVATTSSTNAAIAGPEVSDTVSVVLNTSIAFLGGDTVEGTRTNTLSVQVNGISSSIGSVNWRGVSNTGSCGGVPYRDGQGRFISTCTFKPSDVPGDQVITAEYSGSFDQAAASSATRRVHFVVSRNTLSLPMAPQVSQVQAGESVRVQPLLYRPATDDTYSPGTSGEVAVTIAPNGACDSGAKVGGRMTFTCRPGAPGQHTVTATWAAQFSVREWLPEGGQGTFTYRPTASTSTFRTIGARAKLVPDVTSGTVTAGTPFTLAVHGYDSGDNDLGTPTDAAARYSIAPDGACTLTGCWAETTGPHVVTVTSGTLRGTRTIDVKTSSDDVPMAWYTYTPAGYDPNAAVEPATTETLLTRNERRFFEARTPMPIGIPDALWYIDGAAPGADQYGCRDRTTADIDHQRAIAFQRCEIDASVLAPGVHVLTARLVNGPYGTTRSISRRIRVVSPPASLEVMAPATVYPGQPAAIGMRLLDSTGFDLGALADVALTIDGDASSCDVEARTCTSSSLGTHTVTASANGFTRTARVKVSAGAGFYTRVSVSAARASIPVAGDPGFVVRGHDPDGDIVRVLAPSEQVWEIQYGPNMWASFDPYATDAFTTQGNNNLRVRGSIGGPVPITIVVTPGAVHHYGFDVDTDYTGQTNAGTEYGMRVRAYDRFNNDLGDVTSQFTIMVSGGTCSGSRCTWINSGTQSAMAIAADGTVLSFSRHINHDYALVLRLESTDPTGSVIAGGTRGFRTISYDRFGNRVGVVTGETTFTLDDGDCSGGSCIATTAGTRTVTASYRVPGTGIDVTDELTFQVEPAAIDSFGATADRDTAVAGSDVAVTIVGKDVHGNVVPSAATSAVDVGFDSGDCTRDGAVAHCAARIAGAKRITASFGGVTRTYPVTVTAGNVAGLAIEPIADTAAGTAVAPTIVGWDAFYNVRADAQSLASISAAGTGCIGRTCTIAGTRTVTASIGGVTASRDVQVVAAAAANLVVTGPATVSAGVPVQFAAESFDRFGNSRGDVTGQTAFSVGTVDCPDRSCAPTVATPVDGAGTTIAARAEDGGSNVVGSLTVRVQPGSLDSMVVGRSATSIVAGGSVDVTAVGADDFGNSWGDITSSVTFSIDHGACTGASCTSTRQGTRTITASAYGGVVTATEQVTVTPAAPWRIAVAADAPSRAAGSAFHATATAYDTHGNLIGDVTAATAFTIGGVPCDGAACTSTVMADAVAIRGEYLTLADTVRVDVTAAAPSSLTFGADPVTIVAGATHQYTVLAFDVHGNAIGPVAATVAIGTDACPAGACRSTVAGTHTVTFRYGAATAQGQLVTTPAALDHLDLTLAPATIAAGDSTTVGIVARDQFGNARMDDTTAATVQLGGVACTALVCTTQVAGSHEVEASIPGASGDAMLTVVPAPLHAIAVMPSQATVVAGTDVTVTTTRADRFGNDRGTGDGAVQVQLDGVACDDGSCRLTRAGSRTITASIGSIVGTTSVVVTPAATHTVDVSLADGSIVADGAATTTAHVATNDRFGNPTPTPTASMSLEASPPSTGAPAIGALVPDGTGVWNATVTSSKVLGAWTLTATDATTTPVTTGSAQLLQATGVASKLAFTSAAPTLVADGAATVDVDLHVTDATGHAIAGAAPTVVASGAQVVGAVADRGDGDYRVRITASTVAGTGTLTATLVGGHVATLAFTQVPGAAARVELASDATSIVADGASRAQVTAIVRDAHGNAVSDAGADVAWSVDNGASIVPVARVGATSSASVTSLTAGTATVRAVASGVAATIVVSVTAKPLPPVAPTPTPTPTGTTPASPVVPPASTPAAPPAITPAAVTEIVSVPSVAFNLAPTTPDRTTLPVTCPSTATRGCRGSVTVRATGAKGAVLGSGTVQVEAGASARLVVRLTAAGRRALATTGKVRVTIEVAVSNGAGAPTRVQRTVTIVAAPFAGVAIASTGRVDASGKVAVRVTCPQAAVGTCSGSFDVVRVVDGARVRIVSASFAVPGGRSTVVPVQLTSYSAGLAAATGGLAAEVVAKARDTRPVTRTTTRAFMLVGR